MGKMLKNEVAKNELKEVRHSEEWHKSGEKVKYRLADAMKSCMKKAPVEKITVKEITEECGVTRQTFYRNFQDKYDLINWYFDKILIESFAHMGEGKTTATVRIPISLHARMILTAISPLLAISIFSIISYSPI